MRCANTGCSPGRAVLRCACCVMRHLGKLGHVHGGVYLDGELGAPAHLLRLPAGQRRIPPAALRIEGAHCQREDAHTHTHTHTHTHIAISTPPQCTVPQPERRIQAASD